VLVSRGKPGLVPFLLAKPIASIFFVAYTRDDAGDKSKRPVTLEVVPAASFRSVGS
jgi:hypothetical protein